MSTNRRDFFKTTGLVGAGIVSGAISSCSNSPTSGSESPSPRIWDVSKRAYQQVFNMSGYAAPPIDIVRIGIIGIGNRGLGTVNRMRLIEGVEIKALCDLDMERVQAAQKALEEIELPPAKAYADGSEDLWKKMIADEDLDLIIITTPRAQHGEQCVYAMNHGKHVATEIPAAATIEECWNLIEASERTKKHCMMMENVCYDFYELLILNMVRQGMFGDITHVDTAYTSDQRDLNLRKDLAWRTREMTNRNGNLYPTHGLGPACQVLNINRGDRLDYMTSMSSDDFYMNAEIERRAKDDDHYKPFVGTWKQGNINVSNLRTVNGKTMMLQYNISNPRPGTRIFWVVGSKGISKKYPAPPRISFGKGWISAEEMKALEEKYSPPIIKIVGEMAKKVGGHGGMDFMTQWRLIDCLRNGLPLDQDVYDAAAWSSIVPLSEWSTANYSTPVKIPDFTCGSYKTNAPVDIEMLKGGGNTVLKKIIEVKYDDRGYVPSI